VDYRGEGLGECHKVKNSSSGEEGKEESKEMRRMRKVDEKDWRVVIKK
jgi:hypothetical protein